MLYTNIYLAYQNEKSDLGNNSPWRLLWSTVTCISDSFDALTFSKVTFLVLPTVELYLRDLQALGYAKHPDLHF